MEEAFLSTQFKKIGTRRKGIEEGSCLTHPMTFVVYPLGM